MPGRHCPKGAGNGVRLCTSRRAPSSGSPRRRVHKGGSDMRTYNRQLAAGAELKPVRQWKTPTCNYAYAPASGYLILSV